MEKKNDLSFEERQEVRDFAMLTFYFEEAVGFEVPDRCFYDVFHSYKRFRPVPALGAYNTLGYIQCIQRAFHGHNIVADQEHALKVKKFLDLSQKETRRYRNIVLHIPHSSTAFPNGKYSFEDLDEEERLLVDYYTDELFVPEQEAKNICQMAFPYRRLYCDVERLINDPLEKDGLGISYSRWVSRKDGHGEVLRSFSGKREAFALYSDFHSEVSKKIVGLSGNILLIDCHSFSALPNLLNSNPPDIDICVGYNDDGTCPNKAVIGNIVQYFKSLGYKIGINEPFSNSKTFSVPVAYHSVMIEVNKKLYMNEQTMEKTEGFVKLNMEIQNLYSLLIN
jgi:N-formylglutamate amidohydrolase